MIARSLDGSEVSSGSAAVFLPAVEIPPTPEGFRASTVVRDGDLFIRLEWSPPGPGDRLTAGYVLYSNSPPSPKLWRQASLGTITGQSIEVPVYTAEPEVYRFQLTAKSASHDESPPTPELEVRAGAAVLPPVNLTGLEQQGDRLVVGWGWGNTRLPEACLLF